MKKTPGDARAVVHHVVSDGQFGGGTIFTARLLHELAAAGDMHGQMVLLPCDSDDDTKAVFADLPHILADYASLGSPVAIARAIRRAAGRRGVVHAQGTRAALGAMLAGFTAPGLRTVYTVHGFHGLARPGPFGIRVRLERLLARRMARVVFVSHADAALARAAGLPLGDRAEVIENGLDVPEAAPDAPRDIDLLFLGRMVPQKWPEAFVEALGLMPGAPRVLIAGSGELAADVDARVAALKRAEVGRRGSVAPDAAQALMRRAKIVVMTSRWEGLPTVAIEAARSGAAVAGHRIPPLAEVLGPAADALLTPPDPRALADRLTALLADDAGRAALAGRAQARAREVYAPARMAAGYARLYAALGAGTAPPDAPPAAAGAA